MVKYFHLYSYVFMCLAYVSERLKDYNAEQTKLEPTNCLGIIEYEFLFMEDKTFGNFNQIHANFFFLIS